MMLIDTHTHIYQPAFDADRSAMMERAAAAGVGRFYLPGIDASVWPSMMAMQQQYPSCVAMPGLHPCSVEAGYQQELDFVASCLQQNSYPALGEIGLDFYWDTTYSQQQYAAFDGQMELALQHDLPIVIHTRNAMPETIAAVAPFARRGLRGIFHCFSGQEDQARQIIDMGFLLGIGGVVTYKNSGLAEAIAPFSLNHLVLETDAPYLTPVPFRGKRNEPAYLAYVAARLAELFGVPVNTVAEITSANAMGLYKF